MSSAEPPRATFPIFVHETVLANAGSVAGAGVQVGKLTTERLRTTVMDWMVTEVLKMSVIDTFVAVLVPSFLNSVLEVPVAPTVRVWGEALCLTHDDGDPGPPGVVGGLEGTAQMLPPPARLLPASPKAPAATTATAIVTTPVIRRPKAAARKIPSYALP